MICEMGSTIIPGQEGMEPARYDRATEIANARLIAAAPELLSAMPTVGHPGGRLVKVVAHYEDGSTQTIHGDVVEKAVRHATGVMTNPVERSLFVAPTAGDLARDNGLTLRQHAPHHYQILNGGVSLLHVFTDRAEIKPPLAMPTGWTILDVVRRCVELEQHEGIEP